jgi:hypothetical protein
MKKKQKKKIVGKLELKWLSAQMIQKDREKEKGNNIFFSEIIQPITSNKLKQVVHV